MKVRIMYRKFFGIEENPFSNTPDSKYLFMSHRHKEALAHLVYGVEGDSGFVLLTGEVGTGKTTLCRYLADRLPENVDLALCINPRLSETELLENICEDFGINYTGDRRSVRELTSAINDHLLKLYAKGGRAVLIIDEAQNMDFQLIEQVRMLTNLETTHNKLLQIILIGQSELKSFLEQENLRQVAQRITARYHLDPMNEADARNYIAHRLHVAGLPDDLFKSGAISEVCKQSRGIPRLINSICERCLLGAFAEKKRKVSKKLAHKAAMEVLGLGPEHTPKSVVALYYAVFVSLVLFTFVSFDPFQQNFVPAISQSSTMRSVKTNAVQWIDQVKLSLRTTVDEMPPPDAKNVKQE
jgi:general secretion pathway protein A